ncbi:hypothetical protein EAH89_04220 [Roseomonas nepalensis]|uniref:Entericidin EcnAB n=1 Tax=Muricoccus nepalensis TaxID=1854500 RepID=A0A502GFN2_9PROT|nr:hypothetical protein [Roseomonas nepalensis]TPG60571.1 hypothetical protein EAH89_04220 [Roseomonas nepalensis]
MLRKIPLLVLLAALGGCAQPGPAERAGRSLDRAADRTGDAIGGAARGTGAALDRAGNWVGDRLENGRR